MATGSDHPTQPKDKKRQANGAGGKHQAQMAWGTAPTPPKCGAARASRLVLQVATSRPRCDGSDRRLDRVGYGVVGYAPKKQRRRASIQLPLEINPGSIDATPSVDRYDPRARKGSDPGLGAGLLLSLMSTSAPTYFGSRRDDSNGPWAVLSVRRRRVRRDSFAYFLWCSCRFYYRSCLLGSVSLLTQTLRTYTAVHTPLHAHSQTNPYYTLPTQPRSPKTPTVCTLPPPPPPPSPPPSRLPRRRLT